MTRAVLNKPASGLKELLARYNWYASQTAAEVRLFQGTRVSAGHVRVRGSLNVLMSLPAALK